MNATTGIVLLAALKALTTMPAWRQSGASQNFFGNSADYFLPRRQM